ncbi:MAG TPA: orotate phosphoribosyltransferase [Dehalococcoidia bacterium]|nr:orotate phosphoribosyltransferase [Dehalococcoidia bacterium]
MTKADDKRLLEVFKEKAVLKGDFTLTSGLKSSCYFDGRMVTLWPEGAYLIGKKILDIITKAGAEAVGGMTLGADPIVTAVAVVGQMEGKPLPAFIVRKEPKRHGTQRLIEGHLKKGAKVAIVDDVITTGGSLLRAIETAEAEGCKVVKVVVVLDRNQGGAEEIKRKGYDFAALLSANAQGEVWLA